jgi:ankyrin repeat protein
VLTGNIAVLTDLMERVKVSVDFLSSGNPMALHSAVFAEQEAAASFLLMHCASPDVRNQRGQTALHIAANTGNVVIVVLLAGSADPYASPSLRICCRGLPASLLASKFPASPYQPEGEI